MTWVFVVAFAIVTSVAMFIWLWRNPGVQRQRRLAKTMSREQRRRIARAMRRGEAVSDPRDAALAAEYAENASFVRSRWFASRTVFRIELALVALLAVLAIVAGRWSLIVGLAPPLGLLIAGRLMAERLRRRIAAAAEKNRELAKQFAGTSAAPET